uniref:C-type lectin domain-containing protein n=1 Tax=Maylandia zebra TaxID=106582 RepID=A0A3P9CB26_9CICH
YHFIAENKSWSEAQRYCREKYTDLAKVFDMTDMSRLRNSAQNQGEAWIGLNNNTGGNRTWHWSLPGVEYIHNDSSWNLDGRTGKWSSDECGKEKPFFCYDDKLILIKENKTWEEALDYCRESHRGLVSITNLQEQGWVQDKAKNASSPFVWLSLRYSCTLDLWFWINDKLVCYEKWSREGKTEDCGRAVGMQSGGQYEWVSQRDNEKYNFVCFK